MLDKYILVNGQAVPEPDIRKWAVWFETAERQLALTRIRDITISTVFLGIDQNHFGEGGAPALWETLVSGGPHNEEHITRYSNREDALAGHQKAMVTYGGSVKDWSPRTPK